MRNFNFKKETLGQRRPLVVKRETEITEFMTHWNQPQNDTEMPTVGAQSHS